MLKVQLYLQNLTLLGLSPEEALNKLKEEFFIKNISHDDDDRVILNYNMIDSPKTHEIVRECRGLVLDKDDGWKLIAKAFTRFFNHCETEHLDFDWSKPVEASDKEDGSLILYYFYNGEWRVNTKGSFGHGEINDSGHTWVELFNNTLGEKPEDWLWMLDKTHTYVFELCSVHNKVVRHYDKPISFLLSVFNGEKELDLTGKVCYFQRPKSFIVHSLDEAIAYIQKREIEDKTYEGLVLKDHLGNRMKVKSASYLMLHRSANNGHVSWESIYNSCLTDDSGAEFLSYFPAYTERFDKMKEFIRTSKEEILNLWDKVKDIDSQKDFAMKVKDNKFAPILFAFRKGGETIDELMISRASTFLRIFDKSFQDAKLENLA